MRKRFDNRLIKQKFVIAFEFFYKIVLSQFALLEQFMSQKGRAKKIPS